MSDIELLAQIERYLNGEMTADERARFEALRNDNPGVEHAVKEHQEFTAKLKQYGERMQFENLLNEIHSEIDVEALKEEFIDHPSLIVQLWRNHHSKISVAASIAIFAVLGTLFLTGYLKTQKQEDDLKYLKREIANVKHTSDGIKQSIGALKPSNKQTAPQNFHSVGTGFAISASGYLVTNEHVVRDADSVYVQNADGDAFHAKIVYTDPVNDIAVLKISDPQFKSFGALPYGFKRGKSDLGEDVFTYGFSGYSKDDGVLSKGYVSSGNGYKGDTVKYQLSMDVNFGNSGGPLLDNRGNVIGIISSKQEGVDGAAFAIKSKYLFKAIQAIPADSLKAPINLSSKSSISSLEVKQQVKKISNYVFMLKVYNN